MMAENVVYVRGTRAEVRKLIAAAVSSAAGHGEQTDAVRQLLIRLGMTALTRIRDAFVVKSKGGADDCGLSWPKLSPKTIAYSRRHPGVPQSKERAGFAPSWMLTDKQRKRWWALYRSFLGGAPEGKDFHKYRPTGGTYHTHANAAREAWRILKSEGAKTLMSTYGNEPVLILRSIGLLLNSLSPGTDGDEKVENQVFRIGSGEVIVGTNREWAATHHEGIPGRLPQRRLWPAPSQWTQAWWDDIAEQGKQGLIEIVENMLQRSL